MVRVKVLEPKEEKKTGEETTKGLTGFRRYNIVISMTFIADLHIHSHFSRATARNLDPENLALWAQKKGISLLGTGDFTHPGWVDELKAKLVEVGDGLFQLRGEFEKQVEKEVPPSCRRPAHFLLSGEISCIYKKLGKTRKVHHLIFLPNFAALARFNDRLERIGNIRSDGRPILGLDSRDLLEILLEVSERSFLIPAHVWTPWFSLFGSKSGFETVEACFGDLSGYIRALETGLSSDPPMNRRLTALDPIQLVSNSDAHSPSKLGREANLFDTELTYDAVIHAMSQGHGLLGTVEFFPEEGKYHLDGHRKCGVRLTPEETRALENLCPVCGKPVTVGVLHRVDELADREDAKPGSSYHSLVPLAEILSEIFSCGPATKKVTSVYESLLASLGPELHILLDVSLEDIDREGGPLLREAVNRIRQEKVTRVGGFDGEYGTIRIFDGLEKAELVGQSTLFKRTTKGDAPRAQKPRPQKTPIHKPLQPVSKGENEKDTLLDGLNPEQLEAVIHKGCHLLIMAGPGTGKTLTLTHRIAHMLRTGEVTPDQILALTFTNKAAREMKERIIALIPRREAAVLSITTFHGFCLDVLRGQEGGTDGRQSFSIFSEADVPTLTAQVVHDLGLGKKAISRFVQDLPRLKRSGVLKRSGEVFPEDMVQVLEEYQKRLRELGMLDLDDLEIEAFRLFSEQSEIRRKYRARFTRIFVDEYQDTSPLQAALLKQIVGDDGGELCAIGDADQAIYGFRGADVGNFFRFPDDFPENKVITLKTNYRSTKTILESAASLLGKERPLLATREKGRPISIASCGSGAEEAEMIVEQIERILGGISYFSLDSGRVGSHESGTDRSFGDIAVLFRLNALGDTMEEALSRSGMPYVRSGEKPLLQQYPVDLICRFLKTCQEPENNYHRLAYLAQAQFYEMGGVEHIRAFKTQPLAPLPKAIEEAAALHGLEEEFTDPSSPLKGLKEISEKFTGAMDGFLDTLSLARGIDHDNLLGDRIALMSIHGAKGLEWPVVFIVGCEEGLIPCTLFGDADREEEKRLFYVAMTRAKEQLFFCHAKSRTLNNRSLRGLPSSYISLLPEGLLEPLERGGWKPRRCHKQLAMF